MPYESWGLVSSDSGFYALNFVMGPLDMITYIMAKRIFSDAQASQLRVLIMQQSDTHIR